MKASTFSRREEVSFKEQYKKPNAMFTRHNILTAYTPNNINVYIIKPLSEKEDLNILSHYKHLFL
jgi:hypothetical protein